MFFVLDKGNSEDKAGLFSIQGELLKTFRLREGLTIFENFEDRKLLTFVTDVILSGSQREEFTFWKEKFLQLNSSARFHLFENLHLPVCGVYEGMGLDRVANVCWLKHKDLRSSCVIDVGSAVTFDFLDFEGVYGGGYILPGPGYWIRSLNSVPSLKKYPIQSTSLPFPGQNSEDCLSQGLCVGLSAMVEGVIRECESFFLEEITYYLTGGGGRHLRSQVVQKLSYIPELTLEGIFFGSQEKLQVFSEI